MRRWKRGSDVNKFTEDSGKGSFASLCSKLGMTNIYESSRESGEGNLVYFFMCCYCKYRATSVAGHLSSLKISHISLSIYSSSLFHHFQTFYILTLSISKIWIRVHHKQYNVFTTSYLLVINQRQVILWHMVCDISF